MKRTDAGTLGFAPQKDIVYNKLLPYAERLDAESSEILSKIKGNLSRAVQLRELWPGVLFWTRKLSTWVALDLCCPPNLIFTIAADLRGKYSLENLNLWNPPLSRNSDYSNVFLRPLCPLQPKANKPNPPNNRAQCVSFDMVLVEPLKRNRASAAQQ